MAAFAFPIKIVDATSSSGAALRRTFLHHETCPPDCAVARQVRARVPLMSRLRWNPVLADLGVPTDDFLRRPPCVRLGDGQMQLGYMGSEHRILLGFDV